jgi:hypothetical protein
MHAECAKPSLGTGFPFGLAAANGGQGKYERQIDIEPTPANLHSELNKRNASGM